MSSTYKACICTMAGGPFTEHSITCPAYVASLPADERRERDTATPEPCGYCGELATVFYSANPDNEPDCCPTCWNIATSPSPSPASADGGGEKPEDPTKGCPYCAASGEPCDEHEAKYPPEDDPGWPDALCRDCGTLMSKAPPSSTLPCYLCPKCSPGTSTVVRVVAAPPAGADAAGDDVITEDIALALSDLQRASQAVGECGFRPDRERYEREEQKARVECEKEISAAILREGKQVRDGVAVALIDTSALQRLIAKAFDIGRRPDPFGTYRDGADFSRAMLYEGEAIWCAKCDEEGPPDYGDGTGSVDTCLRCALATERAARERAERWARMWKTGVKARNLVLRDKRRQLTASHEAREKAEGDLEFIASCDWAELGAVCSELDRGPEGMVGVLRTAVRICRDFGGNVESYWQALSSTADKGITPAPKAEG